MKKLTMALLAAGLLVMPAACTRSRNQGTQESQPGAPSSEPSQQPSEQGGGSMGGGSAAPGSQPSPSQPGQTQPGTNP